MAWSRIPARLRWKTCVLFEDACTTSGRDDASSRDSASFTMSKKETDGNCGHVAVAFFGVARFEWEWVVCTFHKKHTFEYYYGKTQRAMLHARRLRE